ncbi:hypothetical protein [Micromonospora chersina]|uniref:hypothetical protein n=1 Tax=Micromonospora chersina TaxID=47854 RepID=UPI0037155004
MRKQSGAAGSSWQQSSRQRSQWAGRPLCWQRIGPQTYVELDGCHRIILVDPPGAPIIAQGGAALAELIDKPRPHGGSTPTPEGPAFIRKFKS